MLMGKCRRPVDSHKCGMSSLAELEKPVENFQLLKSTHFEVRLFAMIQNILVGYRVRLWEYRFPETGSPKTGSSLAGSSWTWSFGSMSPWPASPSVFEITFPTFVLFGRENLFHFHTKFLKLSFGFTSKFLKQGLQCFAPFPKKILHLHGLFLGQIISGSYILNYGIQWRTGTRHYHPILQVQQSCT